MKKKLATLAKSGREIVERVADRSPESVVIDGFDAAIIGTSQGDKLIYDREVMIDVLVDRDGMTYDEAHEFLAFNVESSVTEESVIILDK